MVPFSSKTTARVRLVRSRGTRRPPFPREKMSPKKERESRRREREKSVKKKATFFVNATPSAQFESHAYLCCSSTPSERSSRLTRRIATQMPCCLMRVCVCVSKSLCSSEDSSFQSSVVKKSAFENTQKMKKRKKKKKKKKPFGCEQKRIRCGVTQSILLSMVVGTTRYSNNNNNNSLQLFLTSSSSSSRFTIAINRRRRLANTHPRLR